MTIKISNWYGKLGNNIQQCAIGILIAINRKDRFESIEHEIIKPIRLDFGSRLETFSANYYYWNGNSNTPNISTYKVYKDINYICQKYIFKNLDIPKIEVSNKTLVIHLRSRDVFKYPVAEYVPNPLIYYQNLIDQYEKTIIVTEKDMNNPLLEKLKDNSKVHIQQGTVQQDFATLIGAKKSCNFRSWNLCNFCSIVLVKILKICIVQNYF